ncbi:MAG: hypothetical protein JNM85_07425 [Chthonomonas sp.]|nr:hypothetical protein [Chthonomonas sp.]
MRTRHLWILPLMLASCACNRAPDKTDFRADGEFLTQFGPALAKVHEQIKAYRTRNGAWPKSASDIGEVVLKSTDAKRSSIILADQYTARIVKSTDAQATYDVMLLGKSETLEVSVGP